MVLSDRSLHLPITGLAFSNHKTYAPGKDLFTFWINCDRKTSLITNGAWGKRSPKNKDKPYKTAYPYVRDLRTLANWRDTRAHLPCGDADGRALVAPVDAPVRG